MGIDENQQDRMSRIAARDKEIEKHYKKLVSKRYKHIQLYNDTAILQMVADKFFLSPKTIEDIICGRYKYKNKNGKTH